MPFVMLADMTAACHHTNFRNETTSIYHQL